MENIEKANGAMFYIKENSTGAIMEVVDILPDLHRKGWLHCKTVFCGHDEHIFIGSDRGVSADIVFNSGLYDYGKTLNSLKP